MPTNSGLEITPPKSKITVLITAANVARGHESGSAARRLGGVTASVRSPVAAANAIARASASVTSSVTPAFDVVVADVDASSTASTRAPLATTTAGVRAARRRDHGRVERGEHVDDRAERRTEAVGRRHVHGALAERDDGVEAGAVGGRDVLREQDRVAQHGHDHHPADRGVRVGHRLARHLASRSASAVARSRAVIV